MRAEVLPADSELERLRLDLLEPLGSVLGLAHGHAVEVLVASLLEAAEGPAACTCMGHKERTKVRLVDRQGRHA